MTKACHHFEWAVMESRSGTPFGRPLQCLPSRQAIDEGVADGGGDGAAPFSSFGDDIRDAGFHNGFFGIDDVDETDGDADDQGRFHLASVDEFPQAQEGCRRIADGDDDRPFQGCGFIHGSLGPRRPLGFGRRRDICIGHEADFAAAQFLETWLADTHAGHVGIGHDSTARFQGGQGLFDGAWAEAQVADIVEVGAGVDDALDDVFFVRRQDDVA